MTTLSQNSMKQTANTTAEPNWLTERRAAGLEQFKNLPAPAPNDELWRFASIGRLKIDAYAPTGAPDPATAKALLERSDLVNERAGRSVYVDDHPVCFEGISEALAAKGVLYLPIQQALQSHPELMERYFLQESTELGSAKFFGLHAASTRAGSLLYIPKGVEIEQPLVNYYWTSAQSTAVFPHPS